MRMRKGNVCVLENIIIISVFTLRNFDVYIIYEVQGLVWHQEMRRCVCVRMNVIVTMCKNVCRVDVYIRKKRK